MTVQLNSQIDLAKYKPCKVYKPKPNKSSGTPGKSSVTKSGRGHGRKSGRGRGRGRKIVKWTKPESEPETKTIDEETSHGEQNLSQQIIDTQNKDNAVDVAGEQGRQTVTEYLVTLEVDEIDPIVQESENNTVTEKDIPEQSEVDIRFG